MPGPLNTIDDRIVAERDRDQMRDALSFIRDLATEEYGYTKVGTGGEVVLRKIIQRANDALGE